MKKMFMYALLIPACMGMASSCAVSKMDAKKLDGKWTISEVNGQKASGERTPEMVFNMSENKIHGNGGCNSFNTSVNLDPQNPSSITFNHAATTRMACADMMAEDAIFRAMGEVKAFKKGKNASEVNLVDGAGKVVMLLTKGK